MILVDTTVWIDHFRKGEPKLARLLENGQVLMHPFVVGELACGNLHNRHEVLDLVERLPQASVASEVEARLFLERHALMGRGVGYLDVHLLASVALDAPVRFWTKDRRLAAAAADLGVPLIAED
ncbi:MAG: type II toxin-antitoxin system VapC family toxin [Gemmatimonadota bacterium]